MLPFVAITLLGVASNGASEGEPPNVEACQCKFESLSRYRTSNNWQPVCTSCPEDTDGSEEPSDGTEDSVCNGVKCSGNGGCAPDEIDGSAKCHCDRGWGGEFCDYWYPVCEPNTVMDLLSTVYENDPEIGATCKFWTGVMWLGLDEEFDDLGGRLLFCDCLQWLVDNEDYWIGNLKCVINGAADLRYTVREQLMHHCTQCSYDQIQDMRWAIRNTSAECDAFLGYRDDMPLTWRSPQKCKCLESFGTREDAAAIVHCPFEAHAASTAMIAYDNCANPNQKVCDVHMMLRKMEDELKPRNPAGYETCSNMIRLFFEATPDTFSEVSAMLQLDEGMCECMAVLEEWWADGLDAMDCYSVTFWDNTVHQLGRALCYDMTIYDRIYVWELYDVILPISALSAATGTKCLNAAVLIAQGLDNDKFTSTPSGDARAKELVCQCLLEAESLFKKSEGKLKGELSFMKIWVVVEAMLALLTDWNFVSTSECGHHPTAEPSEGTFGTTAEPTAWIDNYTPMENPYTSETATSSGMAEYIAALKAEEEKAAVYLVVSIVLGILVGLLVLLNCALAYRKHYGYPLLPWKSSGAVQEDPKNGERPQTQGLR